MPKPISSDPSKALNASVSLQMSRMPRAGSRPEMVLRSELHSLGLRFRTQVRELSGTPDIVFTRAKIAVFVDGCFWHGCQRHGALPNHNGDWWRRKLAATRARDERKDNELREQSYLAVHIWEHEDAARAAREIRAIWLERLGLSDHNSRLRTTV